MATEANKTIARRYFDEFVNQGQGVVGEDQHKRQMEHMTRALPSLKRLVDGL
jgi:hypothetical protein